jgi:hypothetical protein
MFASPDEADDILTETKARLAHEHPLPASLKKHGRI